jgi:WD40 repeat protein
VVKVTDTLPTHRCPDCGTGLDQGMLVAGLCANCLLEMALDVSSLEAELFDPEEAPTLVASEETFAEGEIQGERYRIRSLLGRGGMGEVWRAYDLKLRQDVALKALVTEQIEDAGALEMLRQEVRVAREVISPNVCRVFDLQEVDGQELVSMEFIDGTTLAEVLEERSPLDLDEAREIASQFLAGLEAVHDAGLVHRDIKPENIMLTRTGRVVVMDFGIAKALQEGKSSFAGTPAYMSPEQSQAGELDARSDVFSAGVVLAEMVTPGGIRLFEERKALWEALRRDEPELAETPWSRVITRCLEPEPAERYASASELARALEEVTLRAIGDDLAQPYPGLAAFCEDDARFFFGRELEVEALWRKLRRARLLAVVGPSGAGKSSFLRAGLLPVLPEEWRAIVVKPGERPFLSLALALGRELGDAPGVADLLLRFGEPDVAVEIVSEWRAKYERTLVIVDQFEELFTQSPEEVQERFAELLGRLPLEADAHVLLSMRDDFLFHCHRFPPFHPILTDLTLLGPPTGASLRRAIVEPALRCGYRFEAESVIEEMLAEVEGERGALPMVAFTVARLWEERDREAGLLTTDTYKRIGGVGGALAQHAEEVLGRIGEDRIPIVRELFRNLVTAQGTRATRERDDLLSVFERDDPGREGHDLAQGHDPEGDRVPHRAGRVPAAAVLDALIDARLLTSYEVDAPDKDAAAHNIEIVHESLLANWPRLVRWQRQDAEGAKLRDELRHQARVWDEKGRPGDLLWTGTAYREYQLWRERYPGGLTALEQAFAQAMTVKEERRRRRRRVALVSAFTLLLAVMAIISGMWRQAVIEARRAEAQKLLALGEAEIEEYPTATLAYARASLELIDTPGARRLALEALWRGGAERILELPMVYRAFFTPDGEHLVAPSNDSLRLVSKTGDVKLLLESLRAEAYCRWAISDLRSNLVASWCKSTQAEWDSVEGTVQVWSLAEDKVVRTLNLGETGLPITLAHLGPSDYLMTTSEDGRRQAWPLAGGEPVMLPDPPSADSRCLPDLVRGRDLCVRGASVFVRPLDGEGPEVLVGSHDEQALLATAPLSGNRILSVDGSRVDRRIWNLVDGEWRLERELKGGPRFGRFLRSNQGVGSFDASGRRLAVGSRQSRLLGVWDLEGPPEAAPTTYRVRESAADPWGNFHPAGSWVLASYSRALSLWPITGREPYLLEIDKYQWDKLHITEDGRQLLGRDRLWSLTSTGGPVQMRDAGFFALDPGSGCLGEAEGSTVWLSCPGEPSRVLWKQMWPAMDLAFDPSGRMLAFATYGEPDIPERPLLHVYDVSSEELRAVTLPEELHMEDRSGFTDLEFTFDGDLLTGGWGGVWRWEVETGTAEPFHAVGFARVVVSHDGRWALIGEHAPGKTWNMLPLEELTLHDLEGGGSRAIVEHAAARSIALGSEGRIVVTGGEDGAVRVGRVGEEPQLLLGHETPVYAVAVSTDRRWIGSESDDGIRVWPMPDLDREPFHVLPYEELLARLEGLTNLRAVETTESSTGWTLEIGPFPGWEDAPTW